METQTIKPDFQRVNTYPTPAAYKILRTGTMPDRDAERLTLKIRREAPPENNPANLAVKGIPRLIIYADGILKHAEAANPNAPFIYAQVEYAGLTLYFSR